jgi:hypothetical protein
METERLIRHMIRDEVKAHKSAWSFHDSTAVVVCRKRASLDGRKLGEAMMHFTCGRKVTPYSSVSGKT